MNWKCNWVLLSLRSKFLQCQKMEGKEIKIVKLKFKRLYKSYSRPDLTLSRIYIFLHVWIKSRNAFNLYWFGYCIKQTLVLPEFVLKWLEWKQETQLLCFYISPLFFFLSCPKYSSFLSTLMFCSEPCSRSRCMTYHEVHDQIVVSNSWCFSFLRKE